MKKVMFIRSLRLYEKENRYGYADKDTGEIVIAPFYENGKEYPILIDNRNYFAVKYQGKWGLINTDNEVVIDFRYEDIGKPKLEKDYGYNTTNTIERCKRFLYKNGS